MNMNPKISVVIPTANRPELLERAIHSVLHQTYQPNEIIIIDDGAQRSAKETVEKVNDPRIVYMKNVPPMRGGSASRNIGIRASRGTHIAFLDDDDTWLPEKLEKQVLALERASKRVGFCVTAVENMSDSRVWVNPLVVSGEGNFHEITLVRHKGFLTSALVVRRDVFDDVGFFDEDLPSHQEAELMIRITEKYFGYAINEPLVRMDMFSGREHIGGNVERRILGKELLLKKHKAKYFARPDVHAKLLFWLALWCRDGGYPEKACAYVWKAFRISPSVRYAVHAFHMCILMTLIPTHSQRIGQKAPPDTNQKSAN